MNVFDFIVTPKKTRLTPVFQQTALEFPFTYTYYGFGAPSDATSALATDCHLERENNNDEP